MNNLFVYYFSLALPVAAILFWGGHMDTEWLLFSSLFYLLPFRIFLDIWRLLSLEVIEPDGMWVNMIPFVRYRYARVLFLGAKSDDNVTPGA